MAGISPGSFWGHFSIPIIDKKTRDVINLTPILLKIQVYRFWSYVLDFTWRLTAFLFRLLLTLRRFYLLRRTEHDPERRDYLRFSD